MTEGGFGSWSHIDSKGNNNPMKRREIVEKVVKTRRKNNSYRTEKCFLSHLKNMTRISAENNRGKKHSKEWKENQSKGLKRHFSNEDNLQKLRNAHKKAKKNVI